MREERSRSCASHFVPLGILSLPAPLERREAIFGFSKRATLRRKRAFPSVVPSVGRETDVELASDPSESETKRFYASRGESKRRARFGCYSNRNRSFDRRRREYVGWRRARSVRAFAAVRNLPVDGRRGRRGRTSFRLRCRAWILHRRRRVRGRGGRGIGTAKDPRDVASWLDCLEAVSCIGTCSVLGFLRCSRTRTETFT